MSEREKISKLIEKGQLKEALELTLSMLKYQSQQDIHATIVKLLARLNAAENNFNIGQISHEEFMVEKNRLIHVFFDTFNTIVDEQPLPAPIARKGYLAHNIPREMTLNVQVECCIKVSDVEEALLKKTGFRFEDTDFHLRQITRVNLEGKSDAFRIEPITKLKEQTILANEIGTWKFYVTPLKQGTNGLIIRVQGLVHGLGKKNQPQIEEDFTVTVNVTTYPAPSAELEFKPLPIQVEAGSEKYLLPLLTDSIPAAKTTTILNSTKLLAIKTAILNPISMLIATTIVAIPIVYCFTAANIKLDLQCDFKLDNKAIFIVNQDTISNDNINYNAETKMLNLKFKPRFNLWVGNGNTIKVQDKFGKDTTLSFNYNKEQLFGFDDDVKLSCNQEPIATNTDPKSKPIKLNIILPEKVFLIDPSVFVGASRFSAKYIEPQMWQTILPDNFKGKTFSVSIKDGFYNCTEKRVKLDSLNETIRMECPFIEDTIQSIFPVTAILKTAVALAHSRIVVFYENNDVYSKIDASLKGKMQSVFEVPNLTFNNTYRFEIRGFIGDVTYKCVSPFVSINKNEQEVKCDCSIPPSTIISKKIDLVLQNYENLPALKGVNVVFKKTGDSVEVIKDMVLTAYSLTTDVKTDASYRFEVSSSCVQCQTSATIKANTQQVILPCKRIDGAKNCPIDSLCKVTIYKNTGFKKPILYVNGHKMSNFKKSTDNKNLLLTVPVQTKKILFKVEDNNEICKIQGQPVNNQLKLLLSNCTTITPPKPLYEIVFKTDAQIDDKLWQYVFCEWEKNNVPLTLIKDVDYKFDPKNHTIKTKIWDKTPDPKDIHFITLTLWHNSKKLKIGQFNSKEKKDTINCPICLSCLK